MTVAALALPLVLLAAPVAVAPTSTGANDPPPSAWEMGVAVGAGWDSDVDRLDGYAAASGSARVRGWLERRFEPGDDDALWLGLQWSAERFTETPDLDQHRPELSLEWGHVLGETAIARVLGFVGWRAQADQDASGWDGGARAALRLGGPRLGLRLGAGYTHRSASDPALAYDVGRLDLGADASPWRGGAVVVRLGYDRTLDLGGTGGSGRGRGGASGGGTSPDALEVAPAGTSAGVLGVELVQALPAGLSLSLAWTLAYDPARSPAAAHGAAIELAWRR